MEWLDPRVSFNMNRPGQYVWDGGVPVAMVPGYMEFWLENVPFSHLERITLERLGDQALMRHLPESCYGEYEIDCRYGTFPRLVWKRLYLSQELANEYAEVLRERRDARQEVV